MQIHSLQPKTALQKKKRVGRGGKRGTYSGRGIKGQRAHSAGRIRPQVRDEIKRVPKKRGYGANRSRGVNTRIQPFRVVNIGTLEKVFDTDSSVTPRTLVSQGVLRRVQGRIPHVKLLGGGSISHRVLVSGCEVSATAREKIEKAGGTVSPISA